MPEDLGKPQLGCYFNLMKETIYKKILLFSAKVCKRLVLFSKKIRSMICSGVLIFVQTLT